MSVRVGGRATQGIKHSKILRTWNWECGTGRGLSDVNILEKWWGHTYLEVKDIYDTHLQVIFCIMIAVNIPENKHILKDLDSKWQADEYSPKTTGSSLELMLPYMLRDFANSIRDLERRLPQKYVCPEMYSKVSS